MDGIEQQIDQDLAHLVGLQRHGSGQTGTPVKQQLFGARLGQHQIANILKVLGLEIAASDPGLHQQGAHRFLDLGQTAPDQGDGFGGARIHFAIALQGVDGGEHAAQRIVDFVGDAGSQAPDSGEPFRMNDLLLEGLVGGVFFHDAVISLEQLADLVMVGIKLCFQIVRIGRLERFHALGQQHQRARQPLPPGPVDGQQDEQHQQAHHATMKGRAIDTRHQNVFGMNQNQGAQAEALVDDGGCNIKILLVLHVIGFLRIDGRAENALDQNTVFGGELVNSGAHGNQHGGGGHDHF